MLLAAIIVIPMVTVIRFENEILAVSVPRTPTELQISRSIEPITGKKVYVSCQHIKENDEFHDQTTLGKNTFVPYYGSLPVIILQTEVCQAFDEYADLPEKSRLNSGHVQSLLTITHEAIHVTGVKDEATADCYALQNIKKTASSVGATSADAHFLQRLAADLQITTSDPEYLSSECRDGGSLDLDTVRVGIFPY